MKKKIEKPIQSNIVTIEIVHSLLGGLFGDRDRTLDLGTPLTQEDIPADLPLEQKLLGCFGYLAANNVQPTLLNVKTALVTVFSLDAALVDSGVDHIYEKRTGDADLSALSHFVWRIAHERRITEKAKEAYDLIADTKDENLDARLDQALTILGSISSETDETLPEMEVLGLMDKQINEVYVNRALARKLGKRGPTLKYACLENQYDENDVLISEGLNFSWGETALYTALQGTGKTVIGCDTAEHAAWVCGHDVLYIHLETPPEDIIDRSISRNCLIPTDYLHNILDMDNENDPAVKTIKGFHKWLSNPDLPKRGHPLPAGGRGLLFYKYCPGWNVTKINNLIKLMRHRAHIRKRGLQVFLDYYNIISIDSAGSSRAKELGVVALKLRDNIKIENLKSDPDGSGKISMTVFAQETQDEKGNAHAYDSKEIMQYVQVYISIQRTRAETTEMITNPDGTPSKNTVGQPRRWHSVGNWDSDTKLVVNKANRGGGKIGLIKIENNLFRPKNSERDRA